MSRAPYVSISTYLRLRNCPPGDVPYHRHQWIDVRLWFIPCARRHEDDAMSPFENEEQKPGPSILFGDGQNRTVLNTYHRFALRTDAVFRHYL
jgi:hypothetical protein